MAIAKASVEFTCRIELDAETWHDEWTISQVRTRAMKAANTVVILAQKGSGEPVPVKNITSMVTEVILEFQG